jgi:hypothetical protein
MKTLKEFWKFLDGKKAIIGLIGTNILQMDLDIYKTMNHDLYVILLWLFGALAVGGLGHKAIKVVKK